MKKAGYNVDVLDFSKTPLFVLNSYDILHFSSYFYGEHTWKLFFVNHPKKVLTVHGWLKNELLYMLKHGRLGLRAIIGALLSLAMWPIFPLLFDVNTCPSRRTADGARLKNATIIKNAIFPERYLDVYPINVKSNPKQLVFVCCSSGALKEEELIIDKVIAVVNRLNDLLTQQNDIVLLLFGNVRKKVNPKSVHFMGYSRDFLNFLKGSDLLILDYSYPDFSYVAMESAALGIPIAKFSEKVSLEEIMTNQTGFLARTDDEMVQILLDYAANVAYFKPKLAAALRQYVQEERSWAKIAPIWSDLFSKLLRDRE